MSNSILYYPTIEFRHEDYQWLWNAALFADKIYRIVPPGYELNEPRNIRELCSTGEILRFREKRKDERNQFLNAIKTLRNELAQADAPEVIEAIINDEKKKIDSAANEYRKSMDILRVAKFGGILTTVITVAADVLGYCSNFPDLYKGAIESSGLWAGILTGIFEKRVGNINNPYTYLAQIKSTFSYYPGASKLFGGQPQIAKYNYTLYRGFEEFIND